MIFLRLAALAALMLAAACSDGRAPSMTAPAGTSREPGFSAYCAANPGIGVCP